MEKSDAISAELMNANDNNNEWGKVDAHAPIMLAWCLWDITAKGKHIEGIKNNKKNEYNLQSCLQLLADMKWFDKILVTLDPIPYLINMLKNGLDKDDVLPSFFNFIIFSFSFPQSSFS